MKYCLICASFHSQKCMWKYSLQIAATLSRAQYVNHLAASIFSEILWQNVHLVNRGPLYFSISQYHRLIRGKTHEKNGNLASDILQSSCRNVQSHSYCQVATVCAWRPYEQYSKRTIYSSLCNTWMIKGRVFISSKKQFLTDSCHIIRDCFYTTRVIVWTDLSPFRA